MDLFAVEVSISWSGILYIVVLFGSFEGVLEYIFSKENFIFVRNADDDYILVET